jgi:hypothetical protein
VVVTDGVTPNNFRTYKIGGSDHLAVVATISVPKES